LREESFAMKRKRYSEEQIRFALRQAESGMSVEEVIRRLGVSEATFYRWKKKYAGLGVAEIRRLRQLVADLSLDKRMLQDVLSKKW
jgi:putative transposase